MPDESPLKKPTESKVYRLAEGLASGNLTLLKQRLSTMPRQTQVQQWARFAGVRANLEFTTLVEANTVDKIAGEATRKGFTVWASADASGSALYGAGTVMDEDEMEDVIFWLRSITVPGQKGLAMARQGNRPSRLIEFDSSR